MRRLANRFLLVAMAVLLLPIGAFAQAAITGVVKDDSGGVLPGVTVEAASPVLIEKVRSVVSDDTGQYRIVNLNPGTYTVTFSLPGFSTVKREGIELTGTFVATVNGDMKVGALEETITVTGETPIVDVQSAKVRQTVSRDVLAAIPTSKNATGIQALIPGMSNNTDSGGINGSMSGGAGSIHGGRGNDSRTYSDGNNTGWAGGSAGGGNTPNVSGAQEVVLSTSGGLGEAETAGVILNVIPRDGGNNFSGQFSASGANGSMQGSNYTQSLKDQGLKTLRAGKVYDVNPMGGAASSATSCGSTPSSDRRTGPFPACGSTRQPVGGDSTAQRHVGAQRDRAHVAGIRNKIRRTGPSSTPAAPSRAAAPARRRRKPRPTPSSSLRTSTPLHGPHRSRAAS